MSFFLGLRQLLFIVSVFFLWNFFMAFSEEMTTENTLWEKKPNLNILKHFDPIKAHALIARKLFSRKHWFIYITCNKLDWMHFLPCHIKTSSFHKTESLFTFYNNCIIILDLLPHIKVKLIIGYLQNWAKCRPFLPYIVRWDLKSAIKQIE